MTAAGMSDVRLLLPDLEFSSPGGLKILLSEDVPAEARRLSSHPIQL